LPDQFVIVDRHVRVVRDRRVVVRRPGDRVSLQEAADLGLHVGPVEKDARPPAGWKQRRPSLWFVVPAHRRYKLSAACFQALAHTCRQLAALDVDASAVVVADDDNLAAARDAGLATVRSANQPLGRRWNDGYEYAGAHRVDYVVPFGSDDIIDAHAVADGLPGPTEITCFRRSAVVSPDGGRLAELEIPYPGGDGVKIIPAGLMSSFGYRPLHDSRARAMDGSMMERFTRAGIRPTFAYRDRHPLQIVDFKSDADQLTGWDALVASFATDVHDDPFSRLADVYADGVLAPIQALYSRGQPRRRREKAAA
jgi:hypothetical protein